MMFYDHAMQQEATSAEFASLLR